MSRVELGILAEIAHQHGITTGARALRATGIQHEFAAHLSVLCTGLNSMIILRAGDVPNYDRPGAPKPGYVKTKTSKSQGFFNGYLAWEDKFTRVQSEGKVLGLHTKDRDHLLLPITSSDFLHTKQLKVRLEDIVKQLGPEGDLELVSYDPTSKKLVLKFKAGKGSTDFHGQFIIDFNKGTKITRYYSRPWLAADLDALTLQATEQFKFEKKEELPELLAQIKDHEFPLEYCDGEYAPDSLLKPAKVLSRTPKTLIELKAEFDAFYALHSGDEKFIDLAGKLQNIESFEEALKVIGADTLQKLFDHCGLVITSDWDGLALARPLNMDSKFDQSYNSFTVDGSVALNLQTKELFKILKATAVSKDKQTLLDQYLTVIPEYSALYDEFALQRAGIITPFEFLFEQLSNYAYKHPLNIYLGEGTEQLADGMHKDFDRNVRGLFQHGFDFRSPYGVEADGGWIMFTMDGQIYSGKDHQQLVQLLLANDGELLKTAFLDVNPSLDLSPKPGACGWGDVVKKQLELGQPVTKETRKSLRKQALSINLLAIYQDWCQEGLAFAGECVRIPTVFIKRPYGQDSTDKTSAEDAQFLIKARV